MENSAGTQNDDQNENAGLIERRRPSSIEARTNNVASNGMS